MSSQASSPLDSPAGSTSSPAILTPGAKVRALLAQFDSDSESEAGRKGTPSIEKGISAKSPTKVKSAPLSRPTASDDDDDDDEEDDDLPIAPRGRLAASMQTSHQQTRNEESGEEDTPSDAYSRIRRQLLQSNTVGVDSEKEDGSDATGTPVVAKRRQLKRRSNPVVNTPPGSPPSAPASPLFFSSPSPSKRARTSKPTSDERVDSEDDDLSDGDRRKKPNPRFMELVKKQRQKRLEREALDAKRKAERLEQLRTTALDGRQRGTSPADLSEEDSDSENDGAGRKLTSQARPTRKASKKALEEMNRETQRMSRIMQLAHQAQTKKKITKESLFAKFNFPMPGRAQEPPSSATVSSAPNSDGEGNKAHATPPTSPLRDEEGDKLPAGIQEAVVESTEVRAIHTIEENLPMIENITTQPEKVQQPEIGLDKGKGKEIAAPLSRKSEPPRPFRVRLSAQDIKMRDGDLSDDDLEIVTSQASKRKIAVFENIPKRKAQETASHLILRSLAHINSPGKRDDRKRSLMSAAEMDIALRRQARLQAAKERAEKIMELKAKGIYIPSAEERNKEQQEIEDLVERARQEAAEIQRRETIKAKKNGTYEDDGLDDEEDDEYEYEGDEEIQLSGSDEEDAEEEVEDESDDAEAGDQSGEDLSEADKDTPW